MLARLREEVSTRLLYATSSPGRLSLALGAGRPAPKAREKRPGDEVVLYGMEFLACSF